MDEEGDNSWPIICHVLAVDLDADGLLDVVACDAEKNHVTWVRQSPRGDRLTVPTLGPGGRVVRLNCWPKNRSKNTPSHCRMIFRS